MIETLVALFLVVALMRLSWIAHGSDGVRFAPWDKWLTVEVRCDCCESRHMIRTTDNGHVIPNLKGPS